jgi:hypothetical protein
MKNVVRDMYITVKYNHTRFIGVMRVLSIINKKKINSMKIVCYNGNAT